MISARSCLWKKKKTRDRGVTSYNWLKGNIKITKNKRKTFNNANIISFTYSVYVTLTCAIQAWGNVTRERKRKNVLRVLYSPYRCLQENEAITYFVEICLRVFSMRDTLTCWIDSLSRASSLGDIAVRKKFKKYKNDSGKYFVLPALQYAVTIYYDLWYS